MFNTEAALKRPICLIPKSKLGVNKDGISIIALEEFPITQDAFLQNEK